MRSTLRKGEEGRGKREEGRGKREEGRGKREEGRGKREEACGLGGICLLVLMDVVLERCLQELLPIGMVGRVGLVGACTPAVNAQDRVPEGVAGHRRDEFLLGRACAREALRRAGCADEVGLVADADGVPGWPAGWLGCISHTKGTVAAVAASRQCYGVLGLDVEHGNRLSVAAMARVVHPDEAGWVQGDQVRATILFSLKEAFYKAQFVRWRTPGNFRDLALVMDSAEGCSRVGWMAERFAPELRERSADLVFRYALCGQLVVAVCWQSAG